VKTRWPMLGLLAFWSCGRSAPPNDAASAAPAEEPPVALNPEPPIQYPPALFDRGVEGSVVLRLFVDSIGRLFPESTRVAESSGYPGLDSAAVSGAGRLRFAPGRRRGTPVAVSFLQPVEFKHPNTPPPLSSPSQPVAATAAPAPRPQAPAATVTPIAPPRPKPDSARARPDSTRVRPDSARDTTQKSDTNAVAH
jgi:TonB family protein